MTELPNKANLPQALLDTRRFILWFEDRRGDKLTKIPSAPWRTGHYGSASATDPENWTDFGAAVEYAKGKEGYGIGFCFSEADDLIGIDLDDCINESGEVEDWALEIIDEANSYSELSPSERGIHIIGSGTLPGAIKSENIEVYSSNRFFTVTGRVAGGKKTVTNIQGLLDNLWNIYGEKPSKDLEFELKTRGTRVSVPILEVIPTEKLERRGGQLQGPHPLHDSRTGMNFTVNPGKNAWFCHHAGHECGGGPFEWVAVEEGIIECGEWERGETPLKGEKWIRAVEAARQRGYITEEESKELVGKRREELTEKEYQKIAEELAKEDITKKYLDVFSKTVKEERRLVELGLYHLLSAYTPDPINLGLEAPTSEGKTYPIVEVARRFPKEDVWFLGGLSPTALAHDYGELVDKVTGEPLAPKLSRLYERLGEADDMEEKREIKKTLKDLHKRGKYRIDLEGRIIIFLEAPPPETFGRLRPILSHDAPEVSYKFTDRKSKGGPLGQVTTTLRGWPVAVFFKAGRSKRDSQIWDQVESRFTTISPKMDAEKYRAAVKFMARRKGLPSPVLEKELKLEDFEKLEKEIRAIRKRLREITEKAREKSRIDPSNIFWIPFRNVIGEEFPATAGRHMRDSQRFLTALQMGAALNVFSRPILQINEAEYIVVTRRDYDRAVDLFFGEGSETIFTGIPGHVTEFFRRVFVPLWDEKSNIPPRDSQKKLYDNEGGEGPPRGITTADMVQKHKEVFERPISSKTLLSHYLPILEDAGLITRETDPSDKRRNIYQVLRRVITPEKIPLSSLFEKGNKFTKESLKEQLNELGQIFSLKLLLNNKEIDADDLWERFYSKRSSRGNIKRRENKVSNNEKKGKNIPDSQKGIKGNNFLRMKPSKDRGKSSGISEGTPDTLVTESVSVLRGKIRDLLFGMPLETKELLANFNKSDWDRVGNVFNKMAEEGEIYRDKDDRWRLANE